MAKTKINPRATAPLRTPRYRPRRVVSLVIMGRARLHPTGLARAGWWSDAGMEGNEALVEEFCSSGYC